MSVLIIISFGIYLFACIPIFLIAFKLFKFWLKIREEVIIHLSFLIAYLGLIFFSFCVIGLLEIPLTIETSQLSFMGVLYSGFYLEIAFFYLALFSNRHNILEKYLVVIISTAIFSNIVLNVLGTEELISLSFFLCAVSVFLGFYFVFQLYLRVKSSKKFFTTPESLKFIEYGEKLSLFAFLFLVSDGLSFLSLWLLTFTLSELFYFVGSIIVLFTFWGIYYLADLLRVKGQNCDITEIINILS